MEGSITADKFQFHILEEHKDATINFEHVFRNCIPLEGKYHKTKCKITDQQNRGVK